LRKKKTDLAATIVDFVPAEVDPTAAELNPATAEDNLEAEELDLRQTTWKSHRHVTLVEMVVTHATLVEMVARLIIMGGFVSLFPRMPH
jgi:hypothetical protein